MIGLASPTVRVEVEQHASTIVAPAKVGIDPTIDKVIAKFANPDLRAILARVGASVDGANPPSGQTEAL